MADSTAASAPALLAPLTPPLQPEAAIVAGEDDIRFARGPRGYRVRGLSRNLSAESLKVTLRVSAGDHLHLDTLDLYQARARYAFAKGAALALGVAEEVIAGDLSALVLALEPLQEAAIRGALKPDTANDALALSEADEAAGLALLRDPGLVERIISDVAAIGVVGEDINALVGYLACVSRLLDRPLAILIQSTSAAGKSTLMDALLSLMPENQRVHYSAMTGQRRGSRSDGGRHFTRTGLQRATSIFTAVARPLLHVTVPASSVIDQITDQPLRVESTARS